MAAANMFAGTPVRSDYRVVPRVTFTEPPIASVGLTEEQAHATGRDVRCALVEVASVGKALVESDAKGLVKLVADAGSGEILGGHIAAAAAGEMIHEVVAAMAAHATVRDLAEAIHAFPNFAEGVKAAARQWVAARQDMNEGGVDWLLEAASGLRKEPASDRVIEWATAQVCEVMQPQVCGDFS